MPGRKPKMVRRMFSQKAGLIPTVKKTPRGGRIIAKIILRMLMISCSVLNL